MSDEDQTNEKEIAYYSALVTGWLTTRLEHDKSILALSAGGIGLLVSLLTAIGVTSVVLYILYIFAIFSFLLSIISIVVVLRRNSTHLEDVINNTQTSDPILRFLDSTASYAFVIGILFTLAIGLSVGANSLKKNEDTKMTSTENHTTMIDTTKTQKKSYDGVSNMKPPENTNNNNSSQQQSSQTPPKKKD